MKTLTIVNLCAYPIRVIVGHDDFGLEKLRVVKALGRLGPFDVDSITYNYLRLNPSIRIIVES